MKIIRKDFFILKENEKAYFSLLEGLVNSIDENSYLEIIKAPDNYSFRISPSLPLYINMLIEELNNLHNLLNIKLEYGKSLKNSGIINFKIKICQTIRGE